MEKTIKCRICGKPFVQEHGRVTCSYACSVENRRRMKRTAHQRRRDARAGKAVPQYYQAPSSFEPGICVICGERFIPNSAGQKTCSPRCAEINSRRVSLRAYYRRKAKEKGLPFQEEDVPEPRERPLKAGEIYPIRKCHDCGRLTYNYRCEACWAKIRQQEDANW